MKTLPLALALILVSRSPVQAGWLGRMAGAEEPVDGCMLAAANMREVLRAQAYAHEHLCARILVVEYLKPADMGHAFLVFHLDEGWWVYDDRAGARPLPGVPRNGPLPNPLLAARLAEPDSKFGRAEYLITQGRKE